MNYLPYASSPLARLITARRYACGVDVPTFCRLSRIGKSTYYKILSGKTC